jgi:hypothetical protein
MFEKSMLKRLNHTYLLTAGLLYFIFWFATDSYYLPVYVVHIFNFLTYFFILNHISKKPMNESTLQLNLIVWVFIFSTALVAVNNITSFSYRGNFFVFSEADAQSYHYQSLSMAAKSFTDAVTYYLSFKKLEDLGAVLIVSTLYRLIGSNLIVNFFYIVVGLITALGIYRIASRFMSLRYSFVCSVSYALSSFVLWFHSTGLKESFMSMLIVLFFERYYLYLENRRIQHIVYMAVFVSALLLFRPTLIFFCIGGIGLGVLLQRKKGLLGVLLIVLIFISFIGLYPVFESQYNRFLMGGDVERVLEVKESMITGSVQFTYAVNLMAQAIGPLPTILPVDKKVLLSFFSAGLIYKVLLSFFFWIGIYYVFKFKEDRLYPLIFFVFFEMVSLLIILEGLELRKSLPHFSMVYIIAFWFMDKFDHAAYFKNKRLNQKIRIVFGFSSVLVFAMIWFWNVRFQIV